MQQVNGASSGNEKELSASSSSNDDFKSFKSTTSYATASSSSVNDYAESFSLAIGPGCSQEALLCTNYASNDGDFQKVVSRKSAQKMKKMQRLESPAPSSTKAASGSGPIIARELVQELHSVRLLQ